MLHWDVEDQYKAVRNTRTLEAYRARWKAAQRAGRSPLLVLVLAFNPAIVLVALKARIQFSPASIGVAGSVWIVVLSILTIWSVVLTQRYLRNHPLKDES